MEKIVLRDTESHLKNKAIMRHSQYGFNEGKSCLSNLISFHDKVTCLVDEGKAEDIIFLDLVIFLAFDAILLGIPLDKLSIGETSSCYTG